MKLLLGSWIFVSSLAMPFLFGETVTSAQSHVVHAAYRSNWLDGSLQYKKMLIMVMKFNQKDLKIKVGGHINLTNQELAKVCSINNILL
ncbi:unnamed protein product [Diamesa serratosioi]